MAITLEQLRAIGFENSTAGDGNYERYNPILNHKSSGRCEYYTLQVGNQLYLEACFYDNEPDNPEFSINPETWRGTNLPFWNQPKDIESLVWLIIVLTGDQTRVISNHNADE